ncbi:MAG: carboxypeptidase regulatory-like domain-containing protein [Ruminococcus sp.]|nr:carboxypeptidase regulatory-like domain-containing protein [Ruminococcus sp.]
MKKGLMKKLVSSAMVSLMALSAIPMSSSAATTAADPLVVVSLGDSYSSGEGIPAFYGQDKAWEQRVYDEDWLAHRSTKSWPGLLEFPEVSGKMRDYNAKQVNSSKCKWYFGAASGAETKHFCKQTQEKKTYKRLSLFKTLKTTSYLPKQVDYIKKAAGNVDYVTLTIGGNDVGFADIITTCATGSTYLHFGNDKLKLEKQMDSIWAQFATTRANIKSVYTGIQSAAGSQANIIVAGYPKLLDKEGKGVLISEKEATIVNQNVTKFNNSIKDIVNECKNQGLNIYFVDVEAEFDKDGGHQAYSDNAWINKIILTKQDQDLDQSGIASAYSIHPNEEGAKAYARCVNAKIKEIANKKNTLSSSAILASEAPAEEAVTEETPVVSGKICDDSNEAIENAVINVYKDDEIVATTTTDADGTYSFDAVDGDIEIEVQAEGYEDAVTSLNVNENEDVELNVISLIKEVVEEVVVNNAFSFIKFIR